MYLTKLGLALQDYVNSRESRFKEKLKYSYFNRVLGRGQKRELKAVRLQFIEGKYQLEGTSIIRFLKPP